MRCCFLGTAGYHPNEYRHTSSYFLPEIGFALDAGTGFFRVRDLLQTTTLNIFLTHAHLDHVAGLTFLLDVLHGKNVNRLVLHGRKQDLEAVTKGLFDSPFFPLPFQHVGPGKVEYRTQEIKSSFTVEGVRVLTTALDHPGGSVGYRFEFEGRSLAYVTDTRCSEKYLDLIRQADTLIHECNFPDAYLDLAERSGHSTISRVLALAKKAKVRRLYLTHINPLLDPSDPTGLMASKKRWPGVNVAVDGLEIDV